jgi:SAM-dependent methyltransferase
MLNDIKRLDAYRTAIHATVREDDNVVDIGCGTGILTAYAAERTSGSVTGIEYFAKTFEIATRAFEDSTFENVSLRLASSFDISLHSPTVVVTETIGQIGPEENIVEILYDFVRRHPSVRSVIPAKLSVRLQFGKSTAAAGRRAALLAPFQRQYPSGFSLSACLGSAELELSSQPFYEILEDFAPSNDEVDLVVYRLGIDRISAFERLVPVPGEATIVAVFFCAELTEGVYLSSRPGEITHWGNAHYLIPNGATNLLISYRPGGTPVKLKWGI